MIRFGPFDLDVEGGQLRRKGTPVRLNGQPLRVLCFLAARAGQLVSREALQRELWPEGTFVDFDRGLNFCVNRIRRTLGDDARRPVYVETLAGRGYRFIAAVNADVEAPSSPAVERLEPEVNPGARAAAPHAPRPLSVLALAAAVFLSLLAAASGPSHPTGAGSGPALPEGAARVAYVRGLYQARVIADSSGSLSSFWEAARLDPGNAAALSALAEAWTVEVAEGRTTAREGMPLARDAAARSAALADDARAYLVLGTVALRYDWDWEAAERYLRRSIALAPGEARAHLELADLLLVRGRSDEAVHEAQRAEALDPVCPSIGGRVAGSYYAARRFAEAAAALRQAAGVVPGSIGPHEKLFHAYRHADRPREALQEAARVMALVGVTPKPGFLDPARSRQGMEGFVAGTIEYLQRDAAQRPALFADRMAVLHAALGRRQEALGWLDVAAREHALTLPVTLATDPDLDALRGDEAFRALMRRLQLS